jgi:hypothetical protein
VTQNADYERLYCQARTKLQAISDEIDATKGWYFRCLQPHSESILAAQRWLKRTRRHAHSDGSGA